MKHAKILSFSQFTWTFALVLSLLFSQFSGQQHRLLHLKWQSDSQLQLSTTTSSDDTENKNHSCLVFDATTLADAVSACVAILTDIAGKHVLGQAIFATSWVAPVTHYFLSRAPPLLF